MPPNRVLKHVDISGRSMRTVTDAGVYRSITSLSVYQSVWLIICPSVDWLCPIICVSVYVYIYLPIYRSTFWFWSNRVRFMGRYAPRTHWTSWYQLISICSARMFGSLPLTPFSFFSFSFFSLSATVCLTLTQTLNLSRFICVVIIIYHSLLLLSSSSLLLFVLYLSITFCHNIWLWMSWLLVVL